MIMGENISFVNEKICKAACPGAGACPRPAFGAAFRYIPGGSAALYTPSRYEQNRCLPMMVIRGRDQIHELVAVAGLK